jgi:hypothetical protein
MKEHGKTSVRVVEKCPDIPVTAPISHCYSLFNHTVVFCDTKLYYDRGLSICRISCWFVPQDRHVSYVVFWIYWQHNVSKTDSHRPELTDLSHNSVKIHGQWNLKSNAFHWPKSYWELFTAPNFSCINSVLGQLFIFRDFWTLKKGSMGCPETSVRNYY